MEINELREKIKKIEQYIEIIESYDPITIKERAIKLYVQKENVNEVARHLNSLGFRLGNRKFLGKDISDFIRGNPQSELHLIAAQIFNRNRKKY